MTKKIIWRLANRPTPDEIIALQSSGLLTKEEAREILFNEQEDTARDAKSLESEIKFLRELVERLSKNKSNIIETIRYIEKPYYGQRWYAPYATWCSSGTSGNYSNGTALLTSTGTTNALYAVASGTTGANMVNTSVSGGGAGGASFGSIKTF